MAQLNPVLPCMAEPINFKFLWRQDHLSDYLLVICSQPEEQEHQQDLEPQQPEQHTAAVRHQQSAGLHQQQHRQQQEPSVPTQRSSSAANRSKQLEPLQHPQQQAIAAATPAGSNKPVRKRAALELMQAADAAAAAVSGFAPRQTRSLKRQRAADAAAIHIKSETGADKDEPAAAAAATGQCTDTSAGGAAGHKQHRGAKAGKHTNRRAAAAAEGAAAAAAAAGSPWGRQASLDPVSPAAAVAAAFGTEQGDTAAALQHEQRPKGSSTSPCQQQPQQGLRQSLHLQQLHAGRPGSSSAAAAAAAMTPEPDAGAGDGGVQQQQEQQPQPQPQSSRGGGSPAPAAVAGHSQPALLTHAELPVHGAVLSAMSEYFRTLIQSWQGAERRLQMLVGEDEAHVAEALVEFMYTGELPQLGHDDMLRLMRLSDKFQVKNCPAACARRFADTPMEELSLDTVCAIFDWPGFLQEAQPFAGVSSKAWAKLLDVFGDLEAAWQDSTRRQQFLSLPIKAVKKLLASDQLAVVSENTVLVALAGWLEAHARSNSSSGNASSIPGSSNAAAVGGSAEAGQQHQQQQQQSQQQLQVQQGWGVAASAAHQLQQQQLAHKELAELVRLQHLSPAFLGSVLKRLPVMANVASAEALMAAARYAAANEATRNKLHSMPNRFPRMKVLYAAPRARSAVTRLQFEWVLELAAVQAMITQFRASKVTVDRYSEPHYFNGFQWQLVLQVLEPPAKPQANTAAAAASASSIDVFVGTTARIAIGSATHLPDVLYFRGQLAAREVASGDFTFVNRMESGFVCGTAGWGFRNFLRITDWDSEAALRRFFYDGKIHLRCSIDQCE